MEKYFAQTVEKIKLKEDWLILLEDINTVQKLIFKNIDIPLSEKTESKISDNLRNRIKELEEEGIISNKPEENRDFFEGLKKYLRDLPQIKISLAFKPGEDFINKMTSWLEKEANQKIILDIIYKPEVVGGIIVEYQGKLINLSVSKKLKEIIEQKEL